MNELQILSELGKELGGIAYPIILILGLIGSAVGLLYGFFGYKLIKIGYAITGFLIGFTVGITIAVVAGASTGLAVVVGIVCAVALGFLLFKLYKVSLFLQVLLIGTIILFVLFNSMPVAIILSIILAAVAVYMIRPAMILSTALGGALLAGNCIWAIFRVSSFGLTAITVIVLFALGAYFQWKQSGSKAVQSGDASGGSSNAEAGASNISMAMFQDIGRKLGQTSQGAMKKTKDLAETVKLNAKISDEKKKINQQLLELGKLCHENCKVAMPDEYTPFVREIEASNARIAEYSEQIVALKADENAKPAQVADTPVTAVDRVAYCPKCGAAAEGENVFCTGCGCSLSETKTEKFV